MLKIGNVIKSLMAIFFYIFTLHTAQAELAGKIDIEGIKFGLTKSEVVKILESKKYKTYERSRNSNLGKGYKEYTFSVNTKEKRKKTSFSTMAVYFSEPHFGGKVTKVTRNLNYFQGNNESDFRRPTFEEVKEILKSKYGSPLEESNINSGGRYSKIRYSYSILKVPYNCFSASWYLNDYCPQTFTITVTNGINQNTGVHEVGSIIYELIDRPFIIRDNKHAEVIIAKNKRIKNKLNKWKHIKKKSNLSDI